MKLSPELRELLRQCRVQTSYLDVNNKRRHATPEALLAVLRGLGVAIERPEHAGDLLRELRRQRLRRGVEPVSVAWNGRLKAIDVSLPASAVGDLEYVLELDEQSVHKALPLDTLKKTPPVAKEADDVIVYKLSILNRLPHGYHRLRINAAGQSFESLVISAPKRAYNHGEFGNADGDRAKSGRSDERKLERAWGAFLPLYALRREDDWGAGDFSALGRLADWIGRQGGSAVGTLPLLAASLDEPFEQSPYRPVSRQFWNEFYIDVEAIPELHSCESALMLIGAEDFRVQLRELSSADQVDYRRIMALKRQVLLKVSAHFFDAKPADRIAQFERFLADKPEVVNYARFAAAQDRQRTAWMAWPGSMKQELDVGDYDPADFRYHQYVQWIAEAQLEAVKQRGAAVGCGLYLDLPVGVDPGGFDVWQNKNLFVVAASTGAPPDPFFTKGQDWGLPPLHPERIRETGYAHLRQVLAANMRYARYLRIDHAMGWHRLYWIPPGLPATQGAYVGYAADEIYAVACLESHRHQCTLLAENLGTVPPEVGKALDRHGIGSMWVAPYELEPSRRHALTEPPAMSVASLNTHDMPPAAAWWSGADIADRVALDLLSEDEAEAERQDRREAIELLHGWLRNSGRIPADSERQPGESPPIRALLATLAASPAQLVLVTLEDLWLETRSQNMPGTLFERPNWQRKARYAFEQFSHMPEVAAALNQVNELRKRNENSS